MRSIKKSRLWAIAVTVLLLSLFPMSAFATDALTAGGNVSGLERHSKALVAAQAKQEIPDWESSLFAKDSSAYSVSRGRFS